MTTVQFSDLVVKVYLTDSFSSFHIVAGNCWVSSVSKMTNSSKHIKNTSADQIKILTSMSFGLNSQM